MPQQIYAACFYHTQAPGRISIARRAPKGMTDLPSFPQLAPGPWFSSVSEAEYRRRYDAEILAKLDPVDVMLALQLLVYPHDPVLLCWEKLVKPGEFCHRQIVQEWFLDKLGLVIPELKKGQQPEEMEAAKDFSVDKSWKKTYPADPRELQLGLF